MIDVTSKVKCYEKNGTRVPVGQEELMTVKSRGHLSDWIVLEFDGASVTVVKRDLEAAIANAVNTGAR